MVFARLSTQEKEAFFGLLDEYFQSRPELFGSGDANDAESNSTGRAGGVGAISTGSAVSAVQRALAANPEMASKAVSSGLARSNNPYAAAAAANPEIGNSVGRVAAASLAFSGGGSGTGASVSPKAPPPPVLPRRTSTSVSNNSSNDRVAGSSSPGSEVDKLVTRKTSVFNTFKKNQTTPMAPIPPAFSAPKHHFGPPPVRRVPSDTPSATSSTPTSAPVPTFPRRQVPPPAQQQPEEEEQVHGEWAEVLYDYTGEDPGDLTIEAGSRLLVTEKASDDWWKGQIEGRGNEGLFPAAYVKLL